jgi:predicted nicotinamide N-methyase
MNKSHPCNALEQPTDLVRQRVSVPGGDLDLLQPRDAAELPDDGPVEWAPVVPYSSVLWRSGVALARDLAQSELSGRRVVELGCGLGLPSLVAARRGAEVVATDYDEDALALLERNARDVGVTLETACVWWQDADRLVARGPFDLVLAADVLYERSAVGELLSLLPRLGREVWLADPGRAVAELFLERARRAWSVGATVRDGIAIHRLHAHPPKRPA